MSEKTARRTDGSAGLHSSCAISNQRLAGVKEFSARFGYSHLLALDLTLVAGGAGDAMLHSDAPHGVWAFDRELSAEEHPVIRLCMDAPLPFLISEVRKAPLHEGARWTEFLADVVRNGDGLVVPIYRAGQPVAAASFGGATPDTMPLTRASLKVVAHAAMDRSIELRDGRAPWLTRFRRAKRSAAACCDRSV